jgi:hypothetical protein
LLRPSRPLLLSFGVFALLFVLGNVAFRRYERTHFIPFRKLTAAVERGDGCVVFSGGSDMLTAIDLPTIAKHAKSGSPPCLADLTIGGGSPDVRFMAFRKYAATRRPAGLVIGFKGHDIVDAQASAPGYYFGNNAAIFEWGSLADLRTYYPEPSFAALDNAVRFFLFQHVAFGAYRQGIWLKVEMLEERLGMRPKLVKNALGDVQAFLELEANARAAALATRMTWQQADQRLAAWPAELVRAAGDAHVSFVKLPARAVAERAYFADHAAEERFDAFVRRTAAEHGGTFVDLSHEPWVEDSLLVDGLHYAAKGTALISEALGRKLEL